MTIELKWISVSWNGCHTLTQEIQAILWWFDKFILNDNQNRNMWLLHLQKLLFLNDITWLIGIHFLNFLRQRWQLVVERVFRWLDGRQSFSPNKTIKSPVPEPDADFEYEKWYWNSLQKKSLENLLRSASNRKTINVYIYNENIRSLSR